VPTLDRLAVVGTRSTNGNNKDSAMDSPSKTMGDGETRDTSDIELKPVLRSSGSLSAAASEPTNLQDALRALRDAHEEITHLQARLGDEMVVKPFTSRGMDHTEALRDTSTSDTRNGLEQAYEDTHAAPQLTSEDTSTVYCGCVRINKSGTPHPTVTLDQYFHTPFYMLLLKRLPWLVILLMLQSFSASILASYDSYLEVHIVFTYFIPMIVGTGGNAGNQCSVMVTRALALGMGDAEVVRVIKKEAPIAFITAITLGMFAFMRVAIEYPSDTRSAAAIAITLGVSIVISIALGIMFSYGIEKIQQCDPADGATPLLNTISDLIGIGLLCGIAVAVVP
jgi:cation transporter-like permease